MVRQMRSNKKWFFHKPVTQVSAVAHTSRRRVKLVVDRSSFVVIGVLQIILAKLDKTVNLSMF